MQPAAKENREEKRSEERERERESGWMGGTRKRGWRLSERPMGTEGPRGNIFTSPLFFPSLFRLYGVVAAFSPLFPRFVLLAPIENAPRQMKIYRSRCPVGGFNLICHTVVARDCQGAMQRNEEGRKDGEGVWMIGIVERTVACSASLNTFESWCVE